MLTTILVFLAKILASSTIVTAVFAGLDQLHEPKPYDDSSVPVFFRFTLFVFMFVIIVILGLCAGFIVWDIERIYQQFIAMEGYKKMF